VEGGTARNPLWAGPHSATERRAETAEAGQAVDRPRGRASDQAADRSVLASDEGTALDPGVRRDAEQGLGADLAEARVHQGPEDRALAELLGARAATHGRDVFLADGESATDRELMRHELSHVSDGGDDVALRAATYFERRAWLGFFSHYLPRKLLNNYMDDTGTPITLSLTEMQDCNPIVDIRRSSAFMTQVATLAGAGGSTASVSVRGAGAAMTNGTLGNFTVNYLGSVTVTASGAWTFTGTMAFYDFWDFDPRGSGTGRPPIAELKVRVANALLPGSPFHIFSVPAPVTQASTDGAAHWGTGAAPVHVPDRLGSGVADIGGGAAAGGVGGDVVAGPAGGDVGAAGGADVGTQTSEDRN
jgi:hypothetical protein